jgi:hypothetical protein
MLNICFLVLVTLSVSFAQDCSTFATRCLLTDGISAVKGNTTEIVINNGESQYFEVVIDKSKVDDVAIAMTVLYGDPDLYIGRPNQPAVPITFQNAWKSSLTAASRDVITLMKSDLVSGSNTYQIMVYGFPSLQTTSSKYRLLVSSSKGSVQLTEGVPQADTVARGEMKYFEFPLSQLTTAEDLSIVVTSLGGDPDLYVSLTNAHPNRTIPSSYDYSATIYGGDTVVVSATRIQGLAGMIYIGVFGYRAATFTVTVSGNNPITLADGVPQYGFVAGGGTRYYTLQTGLTTHDITITATPRDGDVDIYVLSCAQSALSCPTPSRYHYTWASTLQGYAPDTVMIWNSDPNYIHAPALYKIAVYGVTSSNFTIVGGSASVSPLRLLP